MDENKSRREEIRQYEDLFEKMEILPEKKLSKNAKMVQKALIDAGMDIGAKQIDDTNTKMFAQWVLRTLKRMNKKLFKMYFDQFKKAGIVDHLTT